ncbi:uncharacterized protein [Primulina huaijiensis]|uniref:uncharacterized protein n=1 Tax=Primulina huaijiensis TaxID=1492673 RepID=UPI003CC70D18
MEFHTNDREESMNSSEEAEHESTYIRVRRFYECLFCKRGFDTAQALGGHMNIHRKDTARRNKPTSTPSKCQRTNRSIDPDDWRVMRLDDFPPVIMGGLETNHEEELDLELRLGYDS